ncbi:DUF998 domain-containing protein [Pseudonocardia ailaonensis]|uniref:DUF998 domain-containing protein n=1 Tax=Pseudonocardia ailaonensis TaxID=367279 RepID=A0ABN2NJU0_9PSEU
MPLTRALSSAALAGLALAVVLILGLTLFVSDVDPVRRTISEYGLQPEYRTIFDMGVLAFAAACVLVAAALPRAGIAGWGAATGLGVAALGLATVVVFEKTDWSVGPSLGGSIHRYASLVAFLVLPVAAIVAARGHRGAHAAWSRWLGVASLAWFLPIVAGFALRPVTGRSWWQTIPLGLVERGLALTEVLTVAALAIWGLAASRAVAGAPAGAVPERSVR